jgi:hypothetical protein
VRLWKAALWVLSEYPPSLYILVYKMLWDRKKILNISLWRIIRLSMRPATGLCLHISLERVYCTRLDAKMQPIPWTKWPIDALVT